MRIGFLTTFNQICGIATYSNDVLTAFKMKAPHLDITIFGERTHIVDQEYEKKCPLGSIQRLWSRFPAPHNIGLSPLLEHLSHTAYDIIYIQYQDGIFADLDLLALLHACKEYSIKVFITFHSAEQRLHKGARLINHSDGSFVLLSQAKIRYVAAGAQPEKIAVIPHGYWEAPLQYFGKDTARSELNLSQSARIIASFGFLEQRKGVLEIIQTLPELNKERETIFMHVGAPHPFDSGGQQYLEACIQKIKELGCEKKAFLPQSFVSIELANLMLQASDIIILNYSKNKTESSGAAAFALRFGRPVITTASLSFTPLQECTLQLSDELDIDSAVTLLSNSPTLQEYLIENTKTFLRDNSFRVVAEYMLAVYASDKKAQCGVKTSDSFFLLIYKNHVLQPDAPNGGAENAALCLARFLAKDHKVVFAARFKDAIDSWQGVECWEIDKDYNVEEIIEKANHKGNFYLIAIGGAQCLRHASESKYCQNILFMSHAGSIEDTGTAIDSLALYASKIVCVSEAHRKIFTDAGLPESKSTVIYNGVDTEMFSPPARSHIRTYKKLVFAGALVPGKGLDILFSAYAKLKNIHPDISLHVYGSAAQWGWQPFFDPEEVKEKLPDVQFYGAVAQTELAEAFRQAGVVIVPSTHFECFPLTILEAQACGAPVIASQVGGIPEALEHGVTGILLEEISAQSLFLTLDFFLKNTFYGENMSEAAVKRVFEKFDWQRVAEEVYHLATTVQNMH